MTDAPQTEMIAAAGSGAAVAVESGSHFDPGRLTVVRPSRGWPSLGLRDLWDYRELLYFLALRDVKIRYKQTAIGAAWAIVQPLLTMALFTIVFGHFAKLPSGGVPYALLTYSALIAWQLFAISLTNATQSIVQNQALVTKVYFPRMLIPIAPTVAALVDFGFAFVVLGGLLAWYGVVPTIALLGLPLLALFAMVTSLSVSLWLSALNVKYRDVQYAIPFLIQLWFFATPVAYSPELFPAWLRPWLGLNPMAGVVQSFRWALFGDNAGRFAFHVMGVSVAVVAVLLVGGVLYFRRVERSFADVV